MNGKILLDTNIIIALFSGDTTIQNNLARADEVFVPSIAIGELCFGAHKSARAKENLNRIDEFVAANVALECNTETARRYGEIKNTLRVKGHPIPENDIWIAAIAIEHDLTLVTRDTHFDKIENLKSATW